MGNFIMGEVADLMSRGMKPSRYQHCLEVAKYSSELAACWGRDPDQAYQAGLLHDLYHGVGDGEMLAAAARWGVVPDELEREIPMLLHGPVAAARLSGEFGLEDPEILEAIRLHTLAGAGMGQLAKIVYIADKVEPTRSWWPGQERIRALARIDLDRAMLLAIRHSMAYVLETGQKPHPASHLALEYLEKLIAIKTEEDKYD